MAKLARYFIDRPLLSHGLAVLILALGIVMGLQVKRLGLPQVELDRMSITTFMPGASPLDVELNVTTRIEDAVRSIGGLDHFSSRSAEGVSTIDVFISADEQDKDGIKDEIRRAVQNVPDLPEDAEPPRIGEWDTSRMTIYEIALVLPNGSELELRRHVRQLDRRLRELNRVGRTSTLGFRDPEYQVRLDPAKLRQWQVGVDEVIAAVSMGHRRLSAGSVTRDDQARTVVTVAELDEPEAIADLAVRATGSDRVVRIGDLGEVVKDWEPEVARFRFNGQPGMSILVAKTAASDIIDAVTDIRVVVDAYMAEHRESGLESFPLIDNSIDTANRLSIVVSNALAGFVLVLLMLLIFLEWRVALWAAAGIPLAIAVAAMVMPWMGITVNAISLCGMVVVLGMIVDDAIIVAESVYRSMEGGGNACQAAYEGLRKVATPVLFTILTTIVAFVPIYFLPGMIGDFSGEIPTVVIVMLIASYLEAILLLPAHLADSAKWGRLRQAPGQILMSWWEKIYVAVLHVLLRLRYLVLVGFAGILVFGAWAGYQKWSFKMFPEDQAFQVFIMAQTEPGRSKDYTSVQAARVEQILNDLPDGWLQGYRTTIGIELEDDDALIPVPAQNAFNVYLTLTPANQRSVTAGVIKQRLLRAMRSDPQLNLTDLTIWINSGGPPVGRPVELRVRGEDDAQREAAVAALKEMLSDLPVTEIETDLDAVRPEIQLTPDRAALRRHGVTAFDLAAALRAAVDGTVVHHYQTPSDRIGIRVQVNKPEDAWVPDILVRNMFGKPVPVDRLLASEEVTIPRKVKRYEGERMNLVTANVDLGQATPVQVLADIQPRLAKLAEGFPGLKIEAAGEASKSKEMLDRIIVLLIVAISLVYGLLVTQFGSLTQPVLVILAIPFGLIGIIFAFAWQDLDVTLLAMMGIVGFSGVVVNDSLIMVDYMNNARRQDHRQRGQGFRDQICNGARQRFRPVVLTTLTTCAGLFPTAYGLIGGLETFISPLVMAMTWGLAVGTPAVLVMIPVLYAINDDLATLLWRRREA